MKDIVLKNLNENKIPFDEIIVNGEFPPKEEFWINNNIKRCKNLFFRDNHGKNHFLVVVDYNKKLDIKKLSSIVGRGSLSFASGWRLAKYLGLTPGFISVFGILNDQNKDVGVIIDKDLDQDLNLSFLPNTAGGSFVSLGYNDLIHFLECSGNEYRSEFIS